MQRPHARRAARPIYVALGVGCLGLGIAGIFLPLLPTTPFVLLAGWCFSKGSQRLHDWLLSHRRFGPLVREWEEHRVVRLQAKLLATALIAPLSAYMLFWTTAPVWAKVTAGALVLYGMVYVWSKPSKAPPRANGGDLPSRTDGDESRPAAGNRAFGRPPGSRDLQRTR